MPELPEVETMVRGIRATAEGRTLVRVEFCRCRRRPLSVRPSRRTIARRIREQTVTEVTRLAKRAVLRFDTGDALVFEPRMTGLLLVSNPPTTSHLRLRLHFRPTAGASDHILFWDRRGLGTIALLTAEELRQLQQRLGEDALALQPAQLKQLLAGTRRAIKVALLDQALIGGIGNLYASEILHVAKLSPFRPAQSLSDSEVRRLTSALHDVLLTAIACEGSTLGDGTYRNALNQDGSYQNHHRVYQHAESPCPRCRRGTIRRAVQAQRATFYCDHCQI